MKRIFLSLIVGLSVLSSNAQQQVNVTQALENVLVEMKPVRFTVGKFPIPSEGGHMQGVQYFEANNNHYLVVSGSSVETAYYIVVLLTDSGNRIVRYHPIGELPFKHAGGIQMYGHYLFVGVEDNEEKASSQIHVYDLSNPGVSDQQPLYVIQREGTFKEKTAGAVGITKVDGQYLMAVASWDAKTIDFYWSNMKPLGDPDLQFQLVNTWRQTTADRTDWMNKWWNSYQNINLISGVDGQLYMACFAKNKDGNFLEMFSVTYPENEFQLVKTSIKQFYCVKGASFRNGGGLYVLDQDHIMVLAVSKSPHGKIMVNRFDPKK